MGGGHNISTKYIAVSPPPCSLGLAVSLAGVCWLSSVSTGWSPLATTTSVCMHALLQLLIFSIVLCTCVWDFFINIHDGGKPTAVYSLTHMQTFLCLHLQAEHSRLVVSLNGLCGEIMLSLFKTFLMNYSMKHSFIKQPYYSGVQ